MKLRTIYELAVKKGLREDQRSGKEIKEDLRRARAEYRKSRGLDRAAFDREALKNPYADTRVLYGPPDKEIRSVMVGIDIGVPEILLADRLREKGKDIDLVISHHPSGRAFTGLSRVMHIQSSIWERYGLSKEIASGIMKDRIEQVSRGIAPSNHTRVVDAARLLNIPFMCIHTAADNCVANFLQKKLNKIKPGKLKNILALLKRIPEYKKAAMEGTGPHILIGSENDEAGRIFVDMTGGTSGPDKMFGRLSQSGIKTLVGMHCRESGYKIAKSEFINYIIAGHISSDTLGLNLVLDAIEKRSRLKFTECAGFKRVRRF